MNPQAKNTYMQNKLNILKFIFLVTLLSNSTTSQSGIENVQINQYLPEISLNGLTNKSHNFREYRGKPLIINIWASWCGPCNEEMHSIELLNKKYGKNQFHLIGISIDDDVQTARTFVHSNRLSFDNFIDKDLILENTLGAKTIPLTILVDDKGRVVEKVYGSRDWMSNESKSLIQRKLNTNLR